MNKKTELYIANEVIKGCVLDRPASNGRGDIGYLVYSSYYISKKLVLILKNNKKKYTYTNGEECNIINKKDLKLSHDIIEIDIDNLIDRTDTTVGITNLIPVKKIINTNNTDVINLFIEEYNRLIDDNYFSIDSHNHKLVTEKLNSNRKVKKLAKRNAKKKMI